MVRDFIVGEPGVEKEGNTVICEAYDVINLRRMSHRWIVITIYSTATF